MVVPSRIVVRHFSIGVGVYPLACGLKPLVCERPVVAKNVPRFIPQLRTFQQREEGMKLWALVVAGGLAQTPALACECVFYASDAEMVEAEINRLDSASVALDGEVISSSTSIFGSTTTAIVRPTRIWFGERLREYRIEGQTNCDLRLHVGEKVRIDLRKIPLDTGFLAQIRAQLFGKSPRFRSSGCSNFAEAMRSPKMLRAVYARSRKGR